METPRPILTSRQYGWITLGFVLFVIYGSLVPLTYRHVPLDRAWQRLIFEFSKPIDVDMSLRLAGQYPAVHSARLRGDGLAVRRSAAANARSGLLDPA